MGFIPYGVISKSHGLRGGVRLIIYSADPSNLGVLESVYIKAGDTDKFTEYNIESHSLSGKHIILNLEGVQSIEQADELKGKEVFVQAEQLGRRDEDEFYYHELQGLSVFDKENNLLGNVIKLNASGPQELLEVELENGNEALIPFVEPILVEVNIENKRIVVDPPPGLLDL
ncbi:MAG: 16S rRNA processing protein RimM [Candidatus Dadabacteria bacterium]|nr:16S rRNA processing protein RimM [Candidatus Dadabacteria bacterium]NIY20850.1 16S rRNA processing protein RimM [Candidatus Dadabacteria bacterium]